jgi:hypothetical protein
MLSGKISYSEMLTMWQILLEKNRQNPDDLEIHLLMNEAKKDMDSLWREQEN